MRQEICLIEDKALRQSGLSSRRHEGSNLGGDVLWMSLFVAGDRWPSERK